MQLCDADMLYVRRLSLHESRKTLRTCVAKPRTSKSAHCDCGATAKPRASRASLLCSSKNKEAAVSCQNTTPCVATIIAQSFVTKPILPKQTKYLTYPCRVSLRSAQYMFSSTPLQFGSAPCVPFQVLLRQALRMQNQKIVSKC